MAGVSPLFLACVAALAIGASASIAEDLNTLARLHDTGKIDDEEYAAAKKKALAFSTGCPAQGGDDAVVVPERRRVEEQGSGAAADVGGANLWIKADAARIAMGSDATTSLYRASSGELRTDGRFASRHEIVWEDPNAGDKPVKVSRNT